MDSVDLRVGDLPDKLRHPAVLVPARPGVDQQRRVLRCQGARRVLARVTVSSGPGSACQQAPVCQYRAERLRAGCRVDAAVPLGPGERPSASGRAPAP
eukprot:scaffold32912_cov60-Phaeocystis_antarctica.AAC.6